MRSYEVYLDNVTKISKDIPLPKADYPWRRLFARMIDFGCYWLLWCVFAYFVFQWNVTRNIWGNSIISTFLMFFLEPFLLKLFATTPGKALFGIRMTDLGGGKVPLSAGFLRIWKIVLHTTIPMYSVYQMFRSYKTYTESGVMEWDIELDYIIKADKPALRIAIGIFGLLFTVAAILFAPYVAAMPIHRGDITIEQFTENVNRSLRHRSIGLDTSESIGMRYDGVFGVIAEPARTWVDPFGTIITTSSRPTPPFTVAESNGYLLEVGFMVTGVDYTLQDYFMNVFIYPMFYGFVGAQEEMNAFRMAFKGVHRNVDQRQAMARTGNISDYSFVVAGIEVSMTFFGNFDSGRGSMTFNMRKIR
ncbi:MAG: RDD family protein [Oscillospiraceae bacterium]|nr:RDD family protein [Oscillospiraceae bacterium]